MRTFACGFFIPAWSVSSTMSTSSTVICENTAVRPHAVPPVPREKRRTQRDAVPVEIRQGWPSLLCGVPGVCVGGGGEGQLAQMLRATREGKTRFFGQNTRPYGGGTPLVHAARGGGGGDVAHQEVELVVPGLENRLLRGGGDVASI